MIPTKIRQTKYCNSIEAALKRLGHATNSELLTELRKEYPTLSATTVHRATARLAERKSIAIAPSAKDGSIQYDTNLSAHDHFQCNNCGLMIDVDIKNDIISIIKSRIGGCEVSGRLTIGGICKKCNQKGESI